MPIEGVNSELIAKKIDKKDVEIVPKENLVEWMKTYTNKMNKEFGEVIIAAGAGDIDTLLPLLKKEIEQA